ncbi:hypothetical protein N9L02_03375 [Gammaproteobacteria bacterium]|nr:hypothetical protein [Gammaproteobacteria bacterium]
MKNNLAYIFIFFIFLTGCTTNKQSNQINRDQKHSDNIVIKDPIAVTLFAGKIKPTKPYIILDKQKVSKLNFVGVKRQKASLKDSIRNYASTKGGDAVIDIKNHPDNISYTVISYKTLINTDKV